MNGKAVSYTAWHGVPYRHSRVGAHREHHARTNVASSMAPALPGDATRFDRFPDCFVIPGNPSTEQTGKFPWGFHERKRETTIRTHLAAREAGAIHHPRAPPPSAPATQPPACSSPTLSLTAPTDA